MDGATTPRAGCRRPGRRAPAASRSRLLAPLLAAAAAVALLAACSAEPAPRLVRAGTVDSPADLRAPDRADTVLTLTWPGDDGPASVALSLDQLEQMRTVSADVAEPFLGRTVTFQGVPLGVVLEVAGVPEDVTVLHAVALNEYAVDIPVTVADHPGAILATLADGAPIPVDEGGPTRIVLTADHPDVADEALWIWSLATLEGRG